MASITWPVSLPQNILSAGFSMGPKPLAVRTPMDVGPAKQRRRVSDNAKPMTAAIRVTSAQKATFETFFEDTAEGGTLPFDWADPITGDAEELRFIVPDAYQITAITPNRFLISMRLEVMP